MSRSDPAAGIVFEGVGVQRRDVPVLQGVSIRLAAHRTAVVGANGSGKSTLVRLLNGLMRADSGRVSVHGIDPARQPREARAVVGFVFTNPEAQIVMPTVEEDVAFSLRGRLPRAQVGPRVADTLASYGLGHLASRAAQELSGGEKQLLALASVLVTEPQVLVADEPTTLLDARNARRVGDLLLGLPQRLVLVTHDLRLARRCDEAVLVDGGRVVALGFAGEVVDRYERETE